jgi:hypothetical protein
MYGLESVHKIEHFLEDGEEQFNLFHTQTTESCPLDESQRLSVTEVCKTGVPTMFYVF